jgi:probable phosphoglycerate mutase
MVAEVARILAVYLRRAGFEFNFELIAAGGCLHGLLKAQNNGAGRLKALLQQIGYKQILKVLSSPVGSLPDSVIEEADLICLAERSVEDYGSGLLDSRYRTHFDIHGYFSENLTVSQVNRAEIIGARVEKILGLSLRSIIQKHKRGILAASVQGIRNVYLLVHGAVGLKTDGEYFQTHQLSLSLEGIRQAEALKEDLEAIPLSSIYSSGFRSSFETAKIVAEPHGIQVDARRGLGEIDAGQWGGLSPADIEQLYFSQFGKDLLNFQPSGGETLFECTARVIPTFYEILNSTPGNMAIIGHPIANRIILCQVLGYPLDSLFELDQVCGAVNHIYCEGEKMRLMSLNGEDRTSSRFH